MNEFRVFLSVAVFSLSVYFLVDIIVYGFHWALLLGSFIGFIACHYIWPEKRKYESRWYDWLEFILELPYQAFINLLRFIGRLIRSVFDFDF